MKSQKEKGITLIALVLTIIILLILGGIITNSIIGENGILKNLEISINKNNSSLAEEEVSSLIMSYQIDYINENLHSGISFSKWLAMNYPYGNTDNYSYIIEYSPIVDEYTIKIMNQYGKNTLSDNIIGDLNYNGFVKWNEEKQIVLNGETIELSYEDINIAG